MFIVNLLCATIDIVDTIDIIVLSTLHVI